MKHLAIAAVFLVYLDGCNTTERLPPSDHLIVEVDRSGAARVDDMAVAPQEWSELVQQWHITSAELRTTDIVTFANMLKVQTQLREAGVQSVSITRPGSGHWYDHPTTK